MDASFPLARRLAGLASPGRLLLMASAVALSACASTPEPNTEATAPDRAELVLEKYAAQAAKAWTELAALEGAMAEASQVRDSTHAGELERVMADFVFSGDVEEFVAFMGTMTGWRVLPAQGKRVGNAIVHMQASGRTMMDVLNSAGAQVAGKADLVVTVADRSLRVRYRD